MQFFKKELLKKQISYGNFVRYQPEEVYSKIYNTSVALLDEKPFERCFTDVEEVYYSKPTGNRTLGIECSYCPYKHDCWDNLEFRRQLPSKGKNPKWTWYTKIDPKWMEENVQ